MTYRRFFPLPLLALLFFAGCGGSSEVSFEPTAVVEVTPSPIPRTSTPLSLTPRPTGTSAIRVTTPSGTPPAATTTSEPLPSSALSRAARELDDKLDDFRAAVRDGDNQRALNLQRELLAQLDKAEQVARADKTRFGQQMLGAISTFRAGLGGDLARLDEARAELRKIGGPSATPGTVQSIDNLDTFAGSLADKVTRFRSAMEKNDTASLLSLQSDLLAELNRAEVQLKDSRSKQAELIRSAIGDIRGGMSGETNKLATAESKLREAAGQSARPTQTIPPTTGTPAIIAITVTPQATASTAPRANVQELAGKLRAKLDEYERALQDTSNPQNLERVRRELQEQLGRVEDSIRDDNSQQAGQLRSAIGQVREATGGDTAKIESARRALDAVWR